MTKQLTYILSGLLFLILSPALVLAGGGSITPVNFKHAEQIAGKSFSPEIAVKDPATNYTTGLAGKEFRIDASGLKGASCTTTQKISDNNGTIKADCKADEYGELFLNVFDVSAQQNMGGFSLYLTENSTGFSEEGSKGTYTVSIKQKSFSTPLRSTFPLEAVLYKNGQPVNNYDAIQFFSWQVLDGNIVNHSSLADKNRVMVFEQSHPEKVVVRVLAIMTDGSTAQSGVITITTDKNGVGATESIDLSAVPTPAMTPEALEPEEVLVADDTAVPTPSPVVISASESAEANQALMDEVAALKQKVAEQEEQLNVLQKIVKNLQELVSGWFGGGDGEGTE